jgi:ribonuclease VapC
MFVDASAIIGIIGGEEDRLSLSARLAQASRVYLSPIVICEATAGLARKRACPIEQARILVDLFIEETSTEIIEISATVGQEAIEAFRIYGKGRHKADLNMGD